MTSSPFVELSFNPTDLRPRDLPKAGSYLGSPADAIEAALAVARAAMVKQMKEEVRGLANPTHSQLLRLADIAWQAVFWKYRKISAPVMADAYIQAYRAANAGDVPMSVIYDLADKHAEKIGDYFHQTSSDALADGFNTLVNRRLPARAAADRVLNAYGLTPRQMRTYTAAKQFDTPVSDVMPRSVKAKARAYVDKAFTTRTRKLARQEQHNIDEQAKQFAWMWLQSKGKLNDKAQKIWITAKDERVCPVCGPLHGKKVGLHDQFKTKEGSFWTPGLHPNCRCVVRLIENTFAKADWDPKEHPRGYHGRFSVATRTKTLDVDEEFKRITQSAQLTPQATSIDPQLDLKFAELMHHAVLPQARAQVVRPLPKAEAYVRPAPAAVQAPVRAPAPVLAPAKTKPKVQETKTGAKASSKTGQMRYLIMDDTSFDPRHPNKLALHRDDQMKSFTNRKQAEAYASSLVAGDVGDLVGRISERGGVVRDSQGNQYHLTDDQVYEAVSYIARNAQQGEHALTPEETKLEKPPVFRVEGDNGGFTEVTANDIGRQYKLNRYPFGVRIVAVHEKYGEVETGNLDPLDPTVFEPATSFEGQFRVIASAETRRAKGQEYNVPVMEVRPSRPYLKKRD